MKKFVVHVVVLAILFTMTSCSPPKSSTQSSTQTETKTEAAKTEPKEDAPVVKEEDIEVNQPVEVDEKQAYFDQYYSKAESIIPLSQNMRSGAPTVYWDEGDSIENNNFTRWAERTVGIKWSAKWNAVTQDEDTQKLTLAMASDDLPDMIRALTSSEVMKMARAGQIIPLNDLIDENLSPLSKYMLKEMNDSTQDMHFKMNYYNNQLYALGSYADMVTPQANHWRLDILNELGYDQPPRTIAEVEEVFAKYKEAYPDGICLNLDKDLKMGVNAVFLAYGTQVQSWRKTGDSLTYAPTLPQTKDALAKLAEWYKKGYIDPEFVAQEQVTATQKWEAGNAIFRQREWWSCWGDHINLQVNVPSALVAAGDYWEGPSGEWGSLQIKPNEFEQYCISSKTTPEARKAIMTQFNYFCDSAFRAHQDLQDKFTFYYEYQPEKTAYNLDEVAAATKAGEKIIPRQKFDIPPEEEGPSNGQSSWMAVTVSQGEQFGFRFNQRPNQLRTDFLKIETAQKNNDQAFLDTFTIYVELKDRWSQNNLESLFQNIHFSEKSEAEGHTYFDMQWCPATETQLAKGAYLKKLEDETFAKIIMGELPPEAFDEFVSQWKANGGEEITKEINAWWDTVK